MKASHVRIVPSQPPLTTIALPHVQIGQSAIAALLHTINAEDHAGTEFKVKTQLVVRDSTGPVNSH